MMANFVRSSPGVSAKFGTERKRLHNYSRAAASAGVALRGAWREQEHPASEADVPAAIFGCRAFDGAAPKQIDLDAIQAKA